MYNKTKTNGPPGGAWCCIQFNVQIPWCLYNILLKHLGSPMCTQEAFKKCRIKRLKYEV